MKPAMAKEHPLRRLWLDLKALNDSLDYTDGLNDWWQDFHAEVAYRTKISGEVLAGLEKEKI